jgi:hypothetical protein
MDSVYRRAFDRAQQMVADLLEDEVYRRAVAGVEMPTGGYGLVLEQLVAVFHSAERSPSYRSEDFGDFAGGELRLSVKYVSCQAETTV